MANTDKLLRDAETLRMSGDITRAERVYRKVLRKNPANCSALEGMGTILLVQRKLDKAIATFQKLLRHDPRNVAVNCNLGITLSLRGNWEDALATFENIENSSQEFTEIHNYIGTALAALGRVDEAMDRYRQAISLNPGSADSHKHLAHLLRGQGRVKEAIAEYRLGLRIRPGDAQMHSNLLLCLNCAESMNAKETFAEHKLWGTRQSQTVLALRDEYQNTPDPDRRLRIGYISSDFRWHSVAYFVHDLFEETNKSEFETYGYANVKKPDSMSENLRQRLSNWRDITRMTTSEVVKLIRNDEIDVLVDLAGHTGDNRLLVFAAKPAPLQITYLGYPNTTGLAAMDCRITDDWADPAGTDLYHTETLIRLPRCFLCYHPPNGMPPPRPKTSSGVTFGSFNNAIKMTDDVVALWSEILRSTPGSQLTLKSRGFDHEATRERYESLFSEHGIASEQLRILGRTSAMVDHFSMYNSIDIALDTFPYNGTTTCDALWMGVPVVTLAGQRHAGRVGASIANALELKDLIANTKDEYVTIATQLAADKDRLRGLKCSLREMMENSPLRDGQGLAAALEHVYRQIWRRWCASANLRV